MPQRAKWWRGAASSLSLVQTDSMQPRARADGCGSVRLLGTASPATYMYS